MSSLELLVVGTSPNVAFYAWRLAELESAQISILNQQFPSDYPMKWTSSTLGNATFKPKKLYNHISQIAKGQQYDIVLIHCSSLQDFQLTSQSLAPFLTPTSTVVIESSGYINLEPFISMSLPDMKQLSVISIMNEFDIKQTSLTSFNHTIRGSDSRFYLGHVSKNSKNSSLKIFHKLIKQMQSQMKNHTSLLVANSQKEFQTYQWKLALPRIIFNPLMVLFETPSPQKLSEQILAKPLILGLISELFKIIKKMECKLVKGTESEANMWKNWKELYPVVPNDDQFLELPPFFYNFSKQYDLSIDLLLLQPILLADDNGIRTPYLENLYSIMCQLIKVNNTDDSLFFTSKRSSKLTNSFDKEEYQRMNEEYESKSKNISELDLQVHNLELQLSKLNVTYTDLEFRNRQIVEDVQSQESKLFELNGILNSKESELLRLNAEIEAKTNELYRKQQNVEAAAPVTVQPHTEQARLEPQQVIETYHSENDLEQNIIDSQRAVEMMKTPAAEAAAEFTGYKENEAMAHQSSELKSSEELGEYDLLTGSVMKHVQPQPQQPQAVRNLLLDTQNVPQQPPPNGTGQYQQQQYHQSQPQQQMGYNNGYQHNGYQQNGPGQYQQQQQQQYQQQNGYFKPQQNNMPNRHQYDNGQPWMDQQPPHGLPSNGMPLNSPPVFNNTMLQGNRVNSQGQISQTGSFGGNNAYYNGPPHHNNGSMSGSMNGPNGPMNGGMGGAPNGYGKPRQALLNSSSSYFDMQQANGFMPNGNNVPMGMSKKNARRSMMPTSSQSGNLQGLDMGGRGGMPMPTGPTGERPLGQGRPNGRPMSAMPAMGSPSLTTRKSQQFGNYNSTQKDLHIPPLQSQTLQVPPSHLANSNALTNSSNEQQKIDLNSTSQPYTQQSVSEGAPLGGIRKEGAGEQKKKKKGLFGRKK